MTTRPDFTAHDPRRYQAHPKWQHTEDPAYATPEPVERVLKPRLLVFLVALIGALSLVSVLWPK